VTDRRQSPAERLAAPLGVAPVKRPRGRPPVDDLALIRAAAALEAAGIERATLHRMAAARLHKQRGVSPDHARRRVNALFAAYVPTIATAKVHSEVGVDFGFLLAVLNQTWGKAAAERLRTSGIGKLYGRLGVLRGSESEQGLLYTVVTALRKARGPTVPQQTQDQIAI
jgi:hypothetical protein